MVKQGLQNQGNGLDCFGMMCMRCFKCLNTKCTSQKLVGYDFAEVLSLGRNFEFLSLSEFWMQSSRVLHCYKFVYLYRMDTKSASQQMCKLLPFHQLSCFWSKVKWLMLTCLYWIVWGLQRDCTNCLRSVKIACTKGIAPRLKIDKFAKAYLYENGNMTVMPKIELQLVQCFKSENKAFNLWVCI